MIKTVVFLSHSSINSVFILFKTELDGFECDNSQSKKITGNCTSACGNGTQVITIKMIWMSDDTLQECEVTSNQTIPCPDLQSCSGECIHPPTRLACL